MSPLKIDSQAIVAFFGAREKLDKLIADYKAALEQHSHTINKPAPRTHALIERIVKESEGQYEVVEIEPPELVDYDEEIRKKVRIGEPLAAALTFQQSKGLRREELYRRRFQRQEYGVTWNGYRFSGDLYTVTDLIAEVRGSAATGDVPVLVRTADGEYVELRKSDMQQILDAIVLLTRQTYQNEKRLSELIDAAATDQALAQINLGSGW